METKDAIAALTALGHGTRLAAFRLLVEAGPAGRMAGDIGQALDVPGATLSFHLKELVHAGLVESESQGRYVCYRANFQAMNGPILPVAADRAAVLLQRTAFLHMTSSP